MMARMGTKAMMAVEAQGQEVCQEAGEKRPEYARRRTPTGRKRSGIGATDKGCNRGRATAVVAVAVVAGGVTVVVVAGSHPQMPCSVEIFTQPLELRVGSPVSEAVDSF
jgi:hypothetical protein